MPDDAIGRAGVGDRSASAAMPLSCDGEVDYSSTSTVVIPRYWRRVKPLGVILHVPEIGPGPAVGEDRQRALALGGAAWYARRRLR